MEPFCDPLSSQTFDMGEHVETFKRRYMYLSISRLAADRDELDWVVHPELLTAIVESSIRVHLEFLPECTCRSPSQALPHYLDTSYRRRWKLCNNLGKYIREPSRLVPAADNRCRWVQARLAFIKAARDNLAMLRFPALVKRVFKFPSQYAAEMTRCEMSLLHPYGELVSLKARNRSRRSRETASLPDKDMEPVYTPLHHVGGGAG